MAVNLRLVVVRVEDSRVGLVADLHDGIGGEQSIDEFSAACDKKSHDDRQKEGAKSHGYRLATAYGPVNGKQRRRKPSTDFTAEQMGHKNARMLYVHSPLDAQTRLMMQELLLNVWDEYRIRVLFVTHDIDEAVYLGSRVAVLTRRPGRPQSALRCRSLSSTEGGRASFQGVHETQAQCMHLVREEALGIPGRKERPASEADFAVFLAESADAAV